MPQPEVVFVGGRYGKLTILDEPPGRQNGHRVYWCQCDCGSVVGVKAGHLRAGHTVSCGCHRREQSRQRLQLPAGEAELNDLYREYKKSAQKRGLTFALKVGDFRPLIADKCHYCGAAPRKQRGTMVYNGIDRIDSADGYRAENVVTCCWFCNRAKGDATQEEFLAYLDDVAAYRR